MNEMIAVPKYIMERYIPKTYHEHLQKIKPAHLPNYTNISVSDLAKMQGLNTFDTALPNDFVIDFKSVTGFDPVGHMVMNYDDNTFGKAAAVTGRGLVVLAAYEHIKKMRGHE